MSDWITERQPTRADADINGKIVVRYDGAILKPWDAILPEEHWSHTSLYRHTIDPAPEPPAAEPEPQPAPASPARRFVSISRTILECGDHILDAIDDEGIAWWKRLDTSPHHPAFPMPQPEWHRMTPLPDREVPAQ